MSESAHRATATGPLDGIRVLDLTQVMAGPFTTMILADLGADVIKVESPGVGDQTRRSWGYSVAGRDSRAFLALNRNKRSIAIDLKSEAGLQEFCRLARTADVVIQNWRPGVAERLGVGPDDLAAINPTLIYAGISGFGHTGPYADRPGYDLIAQAMTGVMSVTGEPGGRPVKSGLPVADLGAGLFATIGVLGALLGRVRTGAGDRLETSLFESALAMSVWESTEYWMTGDAPEALGSANRMSAPYQALRTADGYVTVGANNDRLWQRLCEVLELQELLTDPRFADNNARMANRAELAAVLEERLATGDTDTWVERFLAAGVPAGPIRDYAEVLEHDPHVQAREMVAEMDHPVEGRVKVLASPVRLASAPFSVRRPPPLLGADRESVLAELDEQVPRESAR